MFVIIHFKRSFILYGSNPFAEYRKFKKIRSQNNVGS